ncbi:rolling circle replication-associated protein [Shewanella baltica]|uniref:rolling circle replication-associated protein n=1 Tax=Shewanella baltica TaxID=62322 RepID=UPI003D7B842E
MMTNSPLPQNQPKTLQQRSDELWTTAKPIKGARVPVSSVEITEETPPLTFEPQDLTAPRGGIFVSEFEQAAAEKLKLDLMRRNASFFAEMALKNLSPAGRPTAEEARLVKDCKSPTRHTVATTNARKQARIGRYLEHLRAKDSEAHSSVAASLGVNLDASERFIVRDIYEKAPDTVAHVPKVGRVNLETGEILPPMDNSTRQDKSGVVICKTPVVRVSHRAWSNEYRLRVQADMPPSDAPPQQSGDRVTSDLSSRGARNILDAGAYMAAVKGGFTTFLTLTFNSEARERIISGDSTIGAECSRFFDAASKMYQRGWSADGAVLKTENGFDCIGATDFVEPIGDKLDYLWVAEAPKNKQGEVNPHCHVLLRWQVEPYLFHDWAKRIENLWGQGFANLQRIKSANAAGGYLLKALGYLTKGEKADQGEIKGNRYNISKGARAEPWETIASYHAEHMASIIGEIKYKLENRAAPIRKEIGRAYGALEKAIRDKAVMKAQKRADALAKINKRIAELEQKIKTSKAALKAGEVRAQDYQLTFKGAESLAKFFNWAIGARQWQGLSRESEFIENRICKRLWTKGINAARATYSAVRNRIAEKERLWSAWLAEKLAPESDLELEILTHQQNLKEYHEWQYKAC